ncbi:CopG family transcriptional regulator [Paeniroseomonas aquatica]|uniref:CopG family transcriptional regulator n=1 Tax=Paeniroseomonas aquatica TaxID=373043 RepID=A0ABT8A1V5_9PROT|nr:CopG family transcriptional regulator [Paeniroseomonas aquatica]MDN3563697.1 CopG family transcriptional regulator [Paeniroseomonas aquatica]
MRAKATFRLPPDLIRRLADYAARKRVSQAVVVEAALESYLSPDGPDRLEAALARRLDRLSRASERLERHVTIGNEALALFVKHWLTATPPLPDIMPAAARAKGKERYDAFVEALGRRLQKGRTLADDIAADVATPDSELHPVSLDSHRSGQRPA